MEWYDVATAVARRQRGQRLACEREANIKMTEGVDDGVWFGVFGFRTSIPLMHNIYAMVKE